MKKQAVICPTITAYDTHQYRQQMQQVEKFSSRIHIDLMDGKFAPMKSPNMDRIWWPKQLKADLHLMYEEPMLYIDQLINLKPNMVIVHNEAKVHHMHFSAKLHRNNIKTGLAILSETPIEWAHQIMHSFDQVLIFSGKLGHHGGKADLTLLKKVKYLHEHHPEVEIAWDGGINDDNAALLVRAGVTVLNTGGFIQKSKNPSRAYDTIKKEITKNK
jgi:ribulose-phosphate 3-epimerase